MEQVRLFLDGDWADGESTSEIIDKFDGSTLGELHHASLAQVNRAAEAASQAHASHVIAPFDRFAILHRASQLLADRQEQFVETIVAETGFVVADARREVARGTKTLLLCAEEAKQIRGEMIPLDGVPNVSDRLAFTLRKPVGVVCCITPFNSPLNTLLHKVGPAIAAGNAVIVKPARLTPMTATLTVSLLIDSGMPPELIALLHGDGATVGEWLLRNPHPAFYAFTGSTQVGSHLLATIGLRRSQLELGSIASTIVCSDADLHTCAARCTEAAFRKSGQVCTSIQRLYVHESVLDDFVAMIVESTSQKQVGDPRASDTFIGPLISAGEAERVEEWIQLAVDEGASLAAGGHRVGSMVEPTVLLDVDHRSKVMSEEVFGPVVCVRGFSELEDAVQQANDSRYGLAAGIFTSDIRSAMVAANGLRVGAVHINETSNGRLDGMPYGGVKQSGMGREGPRYAVQEMTEERVVSIAW